MRLPHGYTNESTLEGRVVTKRYSGNDAASRMGHEVAALQTLAPYLPVPRLATYDPSLNVIQTEYLTGRHGQELIDEGYGSEVLYACGTLLQQLQIVPPDLLAGVVPGDGPVIVHGDFGPQNLLIDPTSWTVTGLLDWEWVHIGEAIEDLAWAEWIVRMHHRQAVNALPELFRGYGSQPTWEARHAAMIAKCQFLLDYSERNGNAGAVALWAERLQQTVAFAE